MLTHGEAVSLYHKRLLLRALLLRATGFHLYTRFLSGLLLYIRPSLPRLRVPRHPERLAG